MHGRKVNLLDPDPMVAGPASSRNDGVVLPIGEQSDAKSGAQKSDPGGISWPSVRQTVVEIALGFFAGTASVAIRLALNLPSDVLPSFLVVIAVCLVTVAAGFLGGFITMVVGGFLTWYYILNPGGSWSIDETDRYALLGYFAVTSVILATSQLYRLSEQKRQGVALELALREAQHQRLFAREMSHRLKNAMAIVQAIASQTFTQDTPEVKKFEGRLSALASAHNLLNEHVKQPTASMSELVQTAIGPFQDRSDRFRVAGEPIPVPDQQVVSLSIALHELGTNAVKYGALSEPKGWISIAWSIANGELLLEWKEHDGPPVVPPKSKGFGSRLLARAALGAAVSYEPDGLRCTITSPI